MGRAQEAAGNPAADPLREFETTLQAPLQAWVLQRMERRFTLRPMHTDAQGFVVVDLAARR